MQRLQMLHIDCGVDVDPGPQQFLHILVPLGMTAAPRVRMGQFIHQDQLGLPLKRQVQVELPQPDPPVVDRCRRERLKPLQQCQGIRPGVGLDIAGDNVDPLFLGPDGRPPAWRMFFQLPQHIRRISSELRLFLRVLCSKGSGPPASGSVPSLCPPAALVHNLLRACADRTM